MIYLASPCSHPDPAVREARFRAVCAHVADLMRREAFIYSPIMLSVGLCGGVAAKDAPEPIDMVFSVAEPMGKSVLNEARPGFIAASCGCRGADGDVRRLEGRDRTCGTTGKASKGVAGQYAIAADPAICESVEERIAPVRRHTEGQGSICRRKYRSRSFRLVRRPASVQEAFSAKTTSSRGDPQAELLKSRRRIPGKQSTSRIRQVF